MFLDLHAFSAFALGRSSLEANKKEGEKTTFAKTFSLESLFPATFVYSRFITAFFHCLDVSPVFGSGSVFVTVPFFTFWSP